MMRACVQDIEFTFDLVSIMALLLRRLRTVEDFILR